MGQVTLAIGGRSYELGCRDGEEPHLRALGGIVDARVADAGRAVGSGNEARQLVMAALMLADEINDMRSGAADPDAARNAAALAAIVERIEALAERLEKDAQSS